MSKQQYLCIIRSESGTCDQPSPQEMTPEKMQEMMAKFQAWQEKFDANIASMGGKLSGEGKVFSSAGMTDGPYVESKEIVGGFMIIAADSLDEAVQVAQACPPIADSSNAVVEIREIMMGPVEECNSASQNS